jgi:predicted secreted Zn-dependent protease
VNAHDLRSCPSLNRRASSASGIVVEVVSRRYRVVGSTMADARASMAHLGPLRRGKRFAAYTDWEVSWGAQVVDVKVVVTLPDWRPPPNAVSGEIAAWEAFVRRADTHEAEHVELARRAGEAARLALDRTEDPRPAIDAILQEERELDRRALAREEACPHR